MFYLIEINLKFLVADFVKTFIYNDGSEKEDHLHIPVNFNDNFMELVYSYKLTQEFMNFLK